jgi:uncharacterized protein YacL
MVADVISRLLGGAILAAGGWALGEYVADTWGPELYVPWVLGLTVVGAVIGLAGTPLLSVRFARRLAEQAGSIPTSRLLSGVVGVLLGLVVATLLAIPLSRIPDWPGVVLPIALSLFMAYLGAMLMLAPRRDMFQRVVPDLDGPSRIQTSPRDGDNARILLDTSAIIDGRIAAVAATGFLQGTVLIPRFVLDELRHVADSADTLRRGRGRRGLEILSKLRGEERIKTEVVDIDYRNGADVDSKLVDLAKELHASIVTTDFNLNRVAQIEGISVLNVNELANSVLPMVLPGEGTSLKIIQDGKEPGQGVGFLEDGTMVVVESGDSYIGQEIDVVVTRVLQTAAGCMIFAQLKRS